MTGDMSKCSFCVPSWPCDHHLLVWRATYGIELPEALVFSQESFLVHRWHMLSLESRDMMIDVFLTCSMPVKTGFGQLMHMKHKGGTLCHLSSGWLEIKRARYFFVKMGIAAAPSRQSTTAYTDSAISTTKRCRKKYPTPKQVTNQD